MHKYARVPANYPICAKLACIFIQTDKTAQPKKRNSQKRGEFFGNMDANICQRYDVRTPIDGIRGMVEISRHYAENAVDHLSAYEAGRWFILYENI